jgi:glycosyltransferase involved in cell wall biosynthesis
MLGPDHAAMSDPVPTAIASVVIPAHNEEMAIARLLTALVGTRGSGEFDIVVVCNGCTDRTAEAAQAFGPDVRVLELAQPSKAKALRAGDQVTARFPRLYIDADVVIDDIGVRALVDALQCNGIEASAPARRLRRAESSRLVRRYYDVWEQLPQVRSGLFGRGVIAVTERGFQRIRALAPVMSDDLAVSEAFLERERAIVPEATVQIWLPQSLRGLIRRRIRVHTGVVQIDRFVGRPEHDKTSLRDLTELGRRTPSLLPGILVFLAVALASRAGARRRARRGDVTTWLRDDSRE